MRYPFWYYSNPIYTTDDIEKSYFDTLIVRNHNKISNKRQIYASGFISKDARFDNKMQFKEKAIKDYT